MPWKECNRMESLPRFIGHERLRFVARLLGGEKMAVACREFGIAPRAGYKVFNRYEDIGPPQSALTRFLAGYGAVYNPGYVACKYQEKRNEQI